jgi:hypothetical protein
MSHAIVTEHGPKIFAVQADGFHGVFASADRALRWAAKRVSESTYDAIPAGGYDAV